MELVEEEMELVEEEMRGMSRRLITPSEREADKDRRIAQGR